MIELGFIPLSIACKQGELERRSACQFDFCTFKVIPPKISVIPPMDQRSRQDFVPILGCSCYTACSDMGRVVYRGNDAVAATNGDWDLIIKSKLLLMMKSYPSVLVGMPMGIRMTVGFLPCMMKTGGQWAVMLHKGDTFCLLLVAMLLTEDLFYLHTQMRLSAGVTGLIVHCPFRVGGTGDFGNPWGNVGRNNHYQYFKA